MLFQLQSFILDILYINVGVVEWRIYVWNLDREPSFNGIFSCSCVISPLEGSFPTISEFLKQGLFKLFVRKNGFELFESIMNR